MRKADRYPRRSRVMIATAIVGAMVGAMALPAAFADLSGAGSWGGLAWAGNNTGAGNGGAGNGASGNGGSGSGSKGAQSGQGNQGGNAKGQAGPDASSDGKGPQAGGPATTGASGGKPNWAQEGIPEVELGRLSVARSPQKVLDKSLAEALNTLSPEMIAFYDQSLQDMIEDLSLNWDEIALIDSPLQNLALLQDALDGSSALTALGVGTDLDTLVAVFLGVASDKTLPISADTVIAVTTILGTPITGAEAEALAADAESVRIAVVAGHG